MGPSGHGPRRPGPVALRRTRQWGERFSCRIAWLSSEIYVKLFMGHYTSMRRGEVGVALFWLVLGAAVCFLVGVALRRAAQGRGARAQAVPRGGARCRPPRPGARRRIQEDGR